MARDSKYRKDRGRYPWRPWRKGSGEPQPAARVLESVLKRLGGDETYRLMRLWRSWSRVLGEEIAAMARPLGHRGSTLVLGADDPVVRQELSYFQPQILERVNGFLGQDFFDKVVFELLSGRIPLDEIKRREPVGPKAAAPRAAPEPPGELGRLEHLKNDEESVVAMCYRAYCRRFGKS